MKIDSCAFLPKVRRQGIITREVDGELLIYDRTCDKAHCLNETAAAIWKLCNGENNVREIARRLQQAERTRQKVEDSEYGQPSQVTGLPPDERVIWLALEQLRRSQLLEEPKDDVNEKTFWTLALSGIAHMSRREAVRLIGLGAAIALPVVISMTAPTPAEAAVSCGATCHPCNSPIDCCGVCSSSAVPGCGPTTPRCT